MTNTIKTYKTRDSAVTILRKAGVDKSDYNSYITRQGELFVLTISETNSFVMPDGIPAGAVASDEEETMEQTMARINARNAADTARLAATTAAADEDDEQPPKTSNPFASLVKPEKKSKKAAAKAEATKVIKKAAAKAKATPVKKVSDNPNAGVSDWIRGQILKGKTNNEILEASEKAGFDLTGKKRYFPGWYRFDMKKKGAI